MTRGELHFNGSVVKVWVNTQEEGIFASNTRPKDTIKFRSLAEQYQANVLPMLKPASQIVIKSTLGSLCEHFGNMSLSAIGTEEIQRYITSLAVAPKTIKNRIGIMQMCWNRARAWGYVKSNPFEFLSMPRQPLSEARRLSVDDVRAIIRKTDEPFKTMLMILAETGLRGGELVAIRHSDITSGVINIARSAFRKTIQTPKTGNAVRKICISGRLAAILCNETPRIRGFGANDLLFPYKDGCWDNGEITRRLGIGLHQFRHANKSLMQSLGVPEYIQDERMGHAKQGMSGRYTHSSPEDHKKWAEIIGRALSSAGEQGSGNPSEAIASVTATINCPSTVSDKPSPADSSCTENGLSMAMGAD